MRSRFVARGAAGGAVVVALAHCASLSGLDQYTSCAECADSGLDGTAQMAIPPGIDSNSMPPDLDTGIQPVPDVAEVPEDVAAPPEPEAGAPETGGGVDAGHGAKDAGGNDAAPDAPSCNSASCDGCCTASGLCAAGGLAGACGMGGAACQDCTSHNLVCSGRACVTPVPDAGPPPTGCMPTTCGNLCVPYFIQCCKPDQTCGCALLFPMGSCN